MDATTAKFLSKCAKFYPHVANAIRTHDMLNQPTNRYLASEEVSSWFNNAIFNPIATSTRPEAAIKYMVFSVINCLSGRLLVAEYQDVDPNFALNRESYEQIYSEWGSILDITNGQLKLAVLLLDKFAELKKNMNRHTGIDAVRRFLCEEFLNYLTPCQLLFLQAVMGCQSVAGQSMWCICVKTDALFNTPNDQSYLFVTDDPRTLVGNYPSPRQAYCDESQNTYYITRSICTLFAYIEPYQRLTLTQTYDAINILDMPDSKARLDRYLWILTPEQSNIIYL